MQKRRSVPGNSAAILPKSLLFCQCTIDGRQAIFPGKWFGINTFYFVGPLGHWHSTSTESLNRKKSRAASGNSYRTVSLRIPRGLPESSLMPDACCALIVLSAGDECFDLTG